MKLSANPRKLKGLFGGEYYELDIKVTLTDEEIKALRKIKGYNSTFIGLDEAERAMLARLTRLSRMIEGDYKTSLSLSDLSNGITVKANDAAEFPMLLQFQELVEERCKAIKQHLNFQSTLNESFDKGEIKPYETEI